MTSLHLMAKLFIRAQKMIYEIPSLAVNWLKVKVLHADNKILQLKKGDLGHYVAIVAVYPGTSTLNSVTRLVEMLESNGYSVLIVINENSESSRWFEKLSSESRTLIIRPNIGADFGAYKCGFNYLRSYRNNLDVVLIANDSLHYTTSCESGLRPLLNPISSINCLYLNFQSFAHAGSMLIKFNAGILNSDFFWNFWEDYFCTNSKRKIINHGEHRLSEICGINTFKPLTETFLNSILPQPTIIHKLQFLRWTRRSERELFACLASLEFDSPAMWNFAFHYGLKNFQISNSLGMYLSDCFNAPIKMDLVRLGLVTRSDFILLFESSGSDEREIQELIQILDKDSRLNKNGILERIMRFTI